MQTDFSETTHFNSSSHFYVSAQGMLKNENIQEIESIMNTIEKNDSGKNFIFDYSRLEYCSPLGLSVIFIMHQKARTTGKLHVLPPANTFRRTMFDNGIIKENESYSSLEVIRQILDKSFEGDFVKSIPSINLEEKKQ